MALEYHLYLATSSCPDETLAILSGHNIGLEPTPPLHLAGTGVTAVAIATPPTRQAIIQAAFGLTPSVTVSFRLDKLQHTAAGRRIALHAALRMLAESDGVLLFNGELPVCSSTNHQMVLNEACESWADPQLLSLVETPYARAALPSI